MNPTNQELEVPMKSLTNHDYFMNEALKEAKLAFDKGEIPVGAVIVLNNEIIARAHNLRESTNDPTSHAEVNAIKKASKFLNSWRLNECSLYVTLEPCSMCAGAMVQARIKNLYFGAYDGKSGSVSSVIKLLNNPFNHIIKYEGGILEKESNILLKSFFKTLRNK